MYQHVYLWSFVAELTCKTPQRTKVTFNPTPRVANRLKASSRDMGRSLSPFRERGWIEGKEQWRRIEGQEVTKMPHIWCITYTKKDHSKGVSFHLAVSADNILNNSNKSTEKHVISGESDYR